MGLFNFSFKDWATAGAGLLGGAIGGFFLPGLGAVAGANLGSALAGGLVGGAVTIYETGDWEAGFEATLADGAAGALGSGLVGKFLGKTLLKGAATAAGKGAAEKGIKGLIEGAAGKGIGGMAFGGGVGAGIMSHFTQQGKTIPNRLPVRPAGPQWENKNPWLDKSPQTPGGPTPTPGGPTPTPGGPTPTPGGPTPPPGGPTPNPHSPESGTQNI